MTQWLMNLFNWMNDFITGNFGLTIVLFTLLLRLVCLPLDIYSRKGQRDYSKKMKLIQPEMERITKAYKNNQEQLSRKTLELRKKYGIGLMPKGCFAPFIAYPLLIAFFAVFRSMADAQTALLAENMRSALSAVQIGGVDAASHLAASAANGITNIIPAAEQVMHSGAQAVSTVTSDWLSTNSFLWIKNIWQPDAAVSLSVINRYVAIIGSLFSGMTSEILPSASAVFTGNSSWLWGLVPEAVRTGFNGLFILPLLAGGVQFLSFKFNQKMNPTPADPANPNAGQGMNKFMGIFFPILFGYFCLSSSSAIAIYWVTSSLIMILTSYLINKVLDILDKRKEAKAEAVGS